MKGRNQTTAILRKQLKLGGFNKKNNVPDQSFTAI